MLIPASHHPPGEAVASSCFYKNMKRILITGIAGFIGSQLASRLIAEGYEVAGIDDLSAGVKENVPCGADIQVLDIADPRIFPFFRNIDVVFHLAARTCLPDCMERPVHTTAVNVVGTVNVLEAARQAGVPKFIYADTGAEYEGIAELPSRVDCVAPIGIYATSKRAGALFCESYQKFFGTNITTLRYFNVYGPGQDWRRSFPPIMSNFIMRLFKGEPPEFYGTGCQRRDYIYIDDVNDFHMLALEDPRTDGKIFNVGSGCNYAIHEIYELLEEILQTGIAPIHVPDLPGSPESTLADISETLELGWRPRVDMREGLRRTVEYFRTCSGNWAVSPTRNEFSVKLLQPASHCTRVESQLSASPRRESDTVPRLRAADQSIQRRF
jgi:UDP-glucose 4-epimerase